MKHAIPSKLGKYQVLREISRGSMGTVCLGHDPFIDRQVAIKVAHAEQLREEEESGAHYRRMFFNEAHTAGTLAHPNIVAIYDAGVDDETCYIVMEYVEGGQTLRSYTRPQSLLEVERVVEMVFKCAKALDYAHKQGVIHRDIKPTNILVTRALDVKIGDFSIAYMTKNDSSGTLPIGLVGSPRYMSPEQLSEDYYSHRTDLFSLGVIMYELLTGRHPFAAENFSRLVGKILSEEPAPMRELRSDLPEVLESIVRRALVKDPARRYASGLELATDLSRAFDHLLQQPRVEMNAQEKFFAVRELEFFSGFPEAEVWEIVRAATWHEYDHGAQIVAEGDIDDCFYLICQGEVSVRKSGKVLRVLGQGDCFGEMGYLAQNGRTANIVAKGRACLLKINATVVGQVSLNCQVRFLKVFLRTLIQRLSVMNERVVQNIA